MIKGEAQQYSISLHLLCIARKKSDHFGAYCLYLDSTYYFLDQQQ